MSQTTLKMTAYQKLIIALCFILNFNDGIDIMLISFSSTKIIEEWGLSKIEMGYLFSAALAGMTLGGFFIAPLADRLGRKTTFLWALAVESIGMLWIVFTESYYMVLVLRFLTGLGIGGLLPTMAATAAEFSSKKYRDFCVGLVQGGWPVGAILTGLFSAWFIPMYGWRAAFFIAGIISLLMFALVYFFMTDSIEFLAKVKPKNALEKINRIRKKMNLEAFKTLPTFPSVEPRGYKTLFNRRYLPFTLWAWLAIFSGFMTLYSILSWVPTLVQESGFSYNDSALVGVALNVGAAIGSALIGYIGGKKGLHKTIFVFMILAFIAMISYGNLPVYSAFVFVQIFLIGLLVQGGFNGIYPFLSKSYPVEIRSTGIGFSVGFGRFGAILGPSLFGWFFDQGMGMGSLFLIFSLPLLIMGTAVLFGQKNSPVVEHQQ
jgi:AAHS family 4-hydroxybenzoate transporter-like MFS transporter